jgi:hypothetical protein
VYTDMKVLANVHAMERSVYAPRKQVDEWAWSAREYVHTHIHTHTHTHTHG